MQALLKSTFQRFYFIISAPTGYFIESTGRNWEKCLNFIKMFEIFISIKFF